MVTRADASALALALESLRAQEDLGFELVVVDVSTDEAASRAIVPLVDAMEALVPVVRVHAPGVQFGTALTRGARAADGDRVILLRDAAVVGPRFVDAHRKAAAGEVIISPRRALLSRWTAKLPGVTAPRAYRLFARRPDLAERIASDSEATLLDVAALREGFDAAVGALAFDDYLWERFAPLVRRYSASLDGCPLAWLGGLGGYWSAPRRALFELGLFRDAASDWEIVDPELTYRLQQVGAALRVDEAATVFHQVMPLTQWPFCAFYALDDFARRYDCVDAWMLVRYLGGEDVLVLADIAEGLRSTAPDSATRREFVAAVDELVPLLLQDLRVWWSEFV
jgi:glycosyltransferase involved in cell wall biosynthesis